jgi:hypothetical protein
MKIAKNPTMPPAAIPAMAPPDMPVFPVVLGVFVDLLGFALEFVDCEPGAAAVTDGEEDVRQVASLDASATTVFESPPWRPAESTMLNMMVVPAWILASQLNEFVLEIGGCRIKDSPDGMNAC